MTTLLTVLHVLFCVFLILVILLQTGKGSGMGAAFGGGSSTVFGPRGAGSFIGKMTGTVAALFMLTSMTLAWISTSKSTGIRKMALEENKGRSGEIDLKEMRSKKDAQNATEDLLKEADENKVSKDAGVAQNAEKTGDETAAPTEDTTKNKAEMTEKPKEQKAADEASEVAPSGTQTPEESQE